MQLKRKYVTRPLPCRDDLGTIFRQHCEDNGFILHKSVAAALVMFLQAFHLDQIDTMSHIFDPKKAKTIHLGPRKRSANWRSPGRIKNETDIPY